MLATAQTKDTVRHRGMLLDITRSSFAPSATLRRDLARGTVDEEAFAEQYALELRQQWTVNPLPFRQVIDQAKAGDVTLARRVWSGLPAATWPDPARVLLNAATHL